MNRREFLGDLVLVGAALPLVGVHPNGGYYGIDVEAIVTAFEHGLVFTKEDIQRLIATNHTQEGVHL